MTDKIFTPFDVHFNSSSSVTVHNEDDAKSYLDNWAVQLYSSVLELYRSGGASSSHYFDSVETIRSRLRVSGQVLSRCPHLKDYFDGLLAKNNLSIDKVDNYLNTLHEQRQRTNPSPFK